MPVQQSVALAIEGGTVTLTLGARNKTNIPRQDSGLTPYTPETASVLIALVMLLEVRLLVGGLPHCGGGKWLPSGPAVWRSAVGAAKPFNVKPPKLFRIPFTCLNERNTTSLPCFPAASTS